eukprot:16039-Heterococcus_DN1.PRE.3
MTRAGVEPDDQVYGLVINALHAANEHLQAEELYVEMLERGFTLSHWSTRRKGMLDFHNFTEGMTAAAMRIVLRDIVLHNATARTGNSSSSNSASDVHPITNDLHIITGHAMHRVERDSSVLQPLVINMLKQLNIESYVSPTNKGRLTVKSSALQQYAARTVAEQ